MIAEKDTKINTHNTQLKARDDELLRRDAKIKAQVATAKAKETELQQAKLLLKRNEEQLKKLAD